MHKKHLSIPGLAAYVYFASRCSILSCIICMLMFTRVQIAISDRTPVPMTLEMAEKQCEKMLELDQCPAATMPACQLAVDYLQKMKPADQIRLAKGLDYLGWCFRHNGIMQQAEIAARRSLEIRRKNLGENHDDTAGSYETVSIISIEQGKYKEAEDGLRSALKIFIGNHGVKNAQVAMTMNNLSVVLERQSRHGEAEEFNRQAIAIQKESLGAEHIEVSRSLGNLAVLLMHQGKFDGVEDYFRESIKIREKHYGTDHLTVANTLFGLSKYYRSQGLFVDAEKTSRRVLEIRQKHLPADHFDIAVVLDEIGSILSAQKKYSEAITCVESAIRITKKALGDMHPYLAMYYGNLASIYSILGQYELAEKNNEMAISIQKNLRLDNDLSMAKMVHNRAYLLSELGRIKEAEYLYQESLLRLERLFGPENNNTIMCAENLARFYITQSRPDDALKLLRRAVAGVEKQTQTVFSPTRLRDLMALLRIEEETVYGMLLGPHPAAVDDLAMRLTLRRKGREAEVGALNNRLVHRNMGRPEVKQLSDEWNSVRQQRETLLFQGAGKQPVESYRKQLQDLTLLAESLEHRLAVDMPELRNFQPPPFQEVLETVAQQLPKDGVLIDVVWTKPWGRKAKPQISGWGDAHYVALLLFPDQHTLAVDLGVAAQLDRLVIVFLRALASPSSDSRPAAQALYATLFNKLTPYVGGQKDVFLSLDGSLNMVAFDALHDGRDYLLGQYRFHYLTSGRDLLRRPSHVVAGPSVVLGNPLIGERSNVGPVDGSELVDKISVLADLPWAQREADAVARLLSIRAMTGVEAKEDVLRSLHGPRVLHIATHGIFLSDLDLEGTMLPWAKRSALQALYVPGVEPNPQGPLPIRLPGEFGPMNRSALVLAGVRQGLAGIERTRDGLLTAEEARSLDLDGTQLVVLSACETARGDSVAGQGVYGLRRAFLIAGAETLVTSLWSVDDAATNDLMLRYYRKLLDEEKPRGRLGGMVEAMQELRQKPGRSHPYYWAPFVVIGQDGPLR